MAIFRAETKSISRSKGHNLVAAVAYRAGLELTDTNELNPLATTHDYTRKTDVVHREILVPKLLKKKLDDADIELNFQYIANLVEVSETTKRGKMKESARLGREWVLCGVPELSRAENIELFQEFAKQQSEQQNVVSMCFVHDPKAGNDTRSKSSTASGSVKDERNIHAHIVLLTRKLELTESNELQLTDKSDSELSNDERTRPIVANELIGTIDPDTGKKIQQGRGLCSNSDWLKNTRESWADMLNEKLIDKGVQPVTHKSYRELGLDIVPMIHVGNNEYSDDKRIHNERVNSRNEFAIKSAADSCIDKSSESIRVNQQRLDESARAAADERIIISKQRIDEQIRAIKLSADECERVAEFDTRPVRASSTEDTRVREREQLVDTSISKKHYYRDSTAQAINCYENNLRVIASRLVFRKRDSKKYDDRQLEKLDTFYRSLAVRDFATETNVSRDDYIQPTEFSKIVKERLTYDDIINNADIIAIVRDAALERETHLAKTSQNASQSVETVKQYDSSLDACKTANRAIETSIRPTDRFSP